MGRMGDPRFAFPGKAWLLQREVPDRSTQPRLSSGALSQDRTPSACRGRGWPLLLGSPAGRAPEDLVGTGQPHTGQL